MTNETRPLRVFVDGEEIADDSRIRIQGRLNMTLLPDYFEISIYNISGNESNLLKNGKFISVYGEGDAMICSGEVEDIYTELSEAADITVVTISDGKSFWETEISKTIGAGSYLQDALRAVLPESILASYLADNIRFPRGQTFFGRLPDIISSLAKSVDARAYYSLGVLHIVAKGKSDEYQDLSEDDVLGDAYSAHGVIFLTTKVKGFPVGSVLRYGGKRYRMISQSFNADNWKGTWKSDITLMDESLLDEHGMGGG